MLTSDSFWVYDDGGRAAAGYKGSTDDCVTRAIAIAAGLPYAEVYDELFRRAKEYGETRRGKVARHIRKTGASPRTGCHKEVYEPFILDLGLCGSLKWG